MTRLILVRHGETNTNTKGKIHKNNDSENLNIAGVEQIKKLANAIKQYEPKTIYCSNEMRAVESSEIISSLLGIPFFKSEGLEERNWGDYSGLSFQEIKEIAGMEKMSFKERYKFHPPKGESWKEAEERLLKSFKLILLKNKDNTIVLVTHGGPIRILIPTLLNIDKEESYKYDPDNASISIFDYDGDRFTKVIYNDTSHLN